MNLHPFRSRRSAMTLIELLIVLAIVSMLAIRAVNLSSATGAAALRAREWRDALALAEDEIERLRATGAGEDGTRAIDAGRLRAVAEGIAGEIEIRPGPAKDLAEARVRIDLRTDRNDRVVELVALVRREVGR